MCHQRHEKQLFFDRKLVLLPTYYYCQAAAKMDALNTHTYTDRFCLKFFYPFFVTPMMTLHSTQLLASLHLSKCKYCSSPYSFEAIFIINNFTWLIIDILPYDKRWFCNLRQRLLKLFMNIDDTHQGFIFSYFQNDWISFKLVFWLTSFRVRGDLVVTFQKSRKIGKPEV